MSDRSHVLPAPEGEYFENSRFAGLSLLCGVIGIVGLVLSFIGGVYLAGPIQLFLAFRLHLFLHPLHRLSLLDDRASRGRCGMVGCR